MEPDNASPDASLPQTITSAALTARPEIMSSSASDVPLTSIVDAPRTPSQTFLSSSRPPISPWTHVAILTSVLAPVALLPYLAVRRSLVRLHHTVAEISQANAALHRDLKTALLEASVRREEHNRLQALLEETKRDLERVREEETRREVGRVKTDEVVRRDLQELLAERQKTRAGLSTLRELSTSLADIAAFMHEVEVQQGFVSRKNDGRGIERIRQLAYKLQGLPADKDKEPDNTRTSNGAESSGRANASNN